MVSILLPDKIDFRTERVTREKVIFYNVKQSIPRPKHQIYMHLTVPQNKQQKLTKLKEEMDNATVVCGTQYSMFSDQIKPLGRRSTRQWKT